MSVYFRHRRRCCCHLWVRSSRSQRGRGRKRTAREKSWLNCCHASTSTRMRPKNTSKSIQINWPARPAMAGHPFWSCASQQQKQQQQQQCFVPFRPPLRTGTERKAPSLSGRLTDADERRNWRNQKSNWEVEMPSRAASREGESKTVRSVSGRQRPLGRLNRNERGGSFVNDDLAAGAAAGVLHPNRIPLFLTLVFIVSDFLLALLSLVFHLVELSTASALVPAPPPSAFISSPSIPLVPPPPPPPPPTTHYRTITADHHSATFLFTSPFPLDPFSISPFSPFSPDPSSSLSSSSDVSLAGRTLRHVLSNSTCSTLVWIWILDSGLICCALVCRFIRTFRRSSSTWLAGRKRTTKSLFGPFGSAHDCQAHEAGVTKTIGDASILAKRQRRIDDRALLLHTGRDRNDSRPARTRSALVRDLTSRLRRTKWHFKCYAWWWTWLYSGCPFDYLGVGQRQQHRVDQLYKQFVRHSCLETERVPIRRRWWISHPCWTAPASVGVSLLLWTSWLCSKDTRPPHQKSRKPVRSEPVKRCRQLASTCPAIEPLEAGKPFSRPSVVFRRHQRAGRLAESSVTTLSSCYLALVLLLGTFSSVVVSSSATATGQSGYPAGGGSTARSSSSHRYPSLDSLNPWLAADGGLILRGVTGQTASGHGSAPLNWIRPNPGSCIPEPTIPACPTDSSCRLPETSAQHQSLANRGALSGRNPVTYNQSSSIPAKAAGRTAALTERLAGRTMDGWASDDVDTWSDPLPGDGAKASQCLPYLKPSWSSKRSGSGGSSRRPGEEPSSAECICGHADGAKRIDTLRKYHLHHCYHYSLWHVLSDTMREGIAMSKLQCLNYMEVIEQLDNLAAHFVCQFEDIIQRYDCGQSFSSKSSCQRCKVSPIPNNSFFHFYF